MRKLRSRRELTKQGRVSMSQSWKGNVDRSAARSPRTLRAKMDGEVDEQSDNIARIDSSETEHFLASKWTN